MRESERLTAHRWQRLRDRATALRVVRDFFAARDFLEVETPMLVKAPGMEVHLDAVPAGAGYLITSPEYQMKRMLVAGGKRLFQVCKCFRAGEEGQHHSSEFAMIEWYRAEPDLDQIVRDTEELTAAVCTAIAGRPVVRVHGASGMRELSVTPPWPRMTVAEAMQTWAGVSVSGQESAEELAHKVTHAGIDLRGAREWDDIFFTAFVERVDPQMAALNRPLVLTDWPAPLAALARRTNDGTGNGATAERFEAYLGGLELCNAFGELVDPVEQRARFADDLQSRARRGRPLVPVDEAFLASLEEGMPPSAGIALGFDRLVMLATGAATIREVQSFAWDEL